MVQRDDANEVVITEVAAPPQDEPLRSRSIP